MRAWLRRSDFTSAMISSLSFLYLRSWCGRQRAALELELDVLVLEPAQPLVGIGDLVEGLEHLRLELGLDRGERHRAFEIVLVELAFRRLGAPSSSPTGSDLTRNGVAAAGAVDGATVACGCPAAPRRFRRRRPARSAGHSWRRGRHKSLRDR